MSYDQRQDAARGRRLAVITEACTGCAACLPFCPVDCIDDSPTCAQGSDSLLPVHIHEEECIGCEVCARVCEHLDLNAIRMVPVLR
jgi:Pyruvate/2-oxoacid:ferredoxin oxidoreductase delta subunit